DNLTTAGTLTAANVKAGRVNITPSAANTPTSATVTGLGIPSGLTPRAVACPSSGVPGTQILGGSTSNVTTTSMVVWLPRTNTTATGIDWQVIGV
ncbi:hypothetical protein ACFV10_35590, partial [Streptomyces cyaneofuscatus]|uniref:hypothetical protein n=1 Tax=Streptomyces cyaneofuscatus TaxID=66883 RepID=UPI003690C168